jgi:hypothetical protein
LTQLRKRYLRKREFAARYGITIRTLERMVGDGRLPAPDLRLGRLPMWSDEIVTANERRAAAECRPSKPISKETAANGEAAS